MATDKLPIDDLPGDLPEDWKLNDAVTPTGTDAGLSDKHGYNYLMKAVNAAHKKLNALIKALRDNLHAIAYSGSYNDLLNKPSTFPPRTHTHTKVQITDFPTSLPANGGNADTVPWSGVSNKPSVYPPESHSHTPSQVGLGNVSNDAQVKRSEMGVANGVATLDTGGKVPSSQLPSFVDDVLEYTNKTIFPSIGESGKIYVDQTTGITWRWSGSSYVEISKSLALGETSSTAYEGAKGKALAETLNKIGWGQESIPYTSNCLNVGGDNINTLQYYNSSSTNRPAGSNSGFIIKMVLPNNIYSVVAFSTSPSNQIYKNNWLATTSSWTGWLVFSDDDSVIDEVISTINKNGLKLGSASSPNRPLDFYSSDGTFYQLHSNSGKFWIHKFNANGTELRCGLEVDVNGVCTVDKSKNADNASKFGNQLPSFYAKASQFQDIEKIRRYQYTTNPGGKDYFDVGRNGNEFIIPLHASNGIIITGMQYAGSSVRILMRDSASVNITFYYMIVYV